MDWAKQGLYRDTVYLGRCPWLQEVIHKLATETTQHLGEVHYAELHTALSLMPWKALTVAWDDEIYGNMLARRIRAKLEAFHRSDQLVAGNLSLTRWLFHLLRDLAPQREEDFNIAFDWIYAESLAFTILSGDLVVEEIKFLLQIGNARQTILPLDLAALIDGLLLSLKPELLAPDSCHLRGCRCAERIFSHQARANFRLAQPWSVTVLMQQLVPVLQSLWQLRMSTLSVSRGIYTLNGQGTSEPCCLVPIHYLTAEVFHLVENVLMDTHHEIVYLDPVDVPFQVAQMRSMQSWAQIRRRAITFQFVIGVLVSPTGLCGFVSRTPDSMPCVARRFPGYLSVEEYANLTFPTATLEENLALIPPLTGGSLCQDHPTHHGCPVVHTSALAAMPVEMQPCVDSELNKVLVGIIHLVGLLFGNEVRGGMPQLSLANLDPGLVLDSSRKRRRRVLLYQVGSLSPPQVVFVNHDLAFTAFVDILAQHLAAHRTWLLVTRA
eukprot:5843130-Amphidinium_carterae.1